MALGVVLVLVGLAYLLAPQQVARFNARLSLFGDGGDVEGVPPTVFRVVGLLILAFGLWTVTSEGPLFV
ncbi:hypothetical protein [Natronorarus salvus]|uniref:hypothetical protein n=1 Tax=Natronorarus salvus TaxID=3117733 RepID=UPI002F262CDD